MDNATLIERLREVSAGDHEKGCAGRCYECTCGYDESAWKVADEAADRIAALEAEVAALRGNAGPGAWVPAEQLVAAQKEVKRLREALEPFAADDIECPIVDENGWTEFGLSWCRERIGDWFGPSAFRRARAALESEKA